MRVHIVTGAFGRDVVEEEGKALKMEILKVFLGFRIKMASMIKQNE